MNVKDTLESVSFKYNLKYWIVIISWSLYSIFPLMDMSFYVEFCHCMITPGLCNHLLSEEEGCSSPAASQQALCLGTLCLREAKKQRERRNGKWCVTFSCPSWRGSVAMKLGRREMHIKCGISFYIIKAQRRRKKNSHCNNYTFLLCQWLCRWV